MSTNSLRLRAALVLSLSAAWLPASQAAGPDTKALFPAGAQRGATVEVNSVGDARHWPPQVWVSRPGITLVPTAEKNKFSATVAADAARGLAWIRVYDAEGTSAPLPFVVGVVPEIVEIEPNNSVARAQAIEVPAATVNGRLSSSGEVDTYSVALAKGETLVASLTANEVLGSAVDAAMQIVSPRGRVVAFNHDQRGLDPEIAFVAPEQGTYGVRIFGFPSTPNSTIGFTGNNRLVYRLTLTRQGFLDAALPLAVTRDRATRVELFGWNLGEAARFVEVLAKDEGHNNARYVVDNPELVNTLALAVEPHASIVETEPNAATMPQAIELPVTISGRIDAPRDVDVFRFSAKPGESLVFELASRALGYPLDAVLEIRDASGKSLARVDDAAGGRDGSLVFAPPAEGQFDVSVRDLSDHGGPRYFYRLRAARPEPDFAVTADAAAYSVVPGKPTEITLTIERRHGFAQPINLRATGLPAEVTANPVVSAAEGDSSKSVKLVLASNGPAFMGPFGIAAESTGDKPLTRAVEAALAEQNARLSQLWLTVTAAQAAEPAK